MDIPFEKKKKKSKKERKAEELEEQSIDSLDVRGVNVYDYAEARAYEINNLKVALQDSTAGKRAFQCVPAHLRRRAASHNIKRLPKRLRDRAEREMHPETAKRSRKFKRRPQNLRDEYSRRSRINCWLETHLWHAKRFHMVDKWGYRLPLHSSAKGFRAAYRTSKNKAIMQDKSYLEVIEIDSDYKKFIERIKNYTSSSTGKQFENEEFKQGKTFVECLIYETYPVKCVGPAKFLHVPGSEKNKIIALTHPQISTKLTELFTTLFASGIYNITEAENARTVTCHKLDFAIFSLDGPTSLNILQQTLQFSTQIKINNSVTNLLVEDPRFHLPAKKDVPDGENCIGKIVKGASTLWCETTRAMVKKEQLTDHQINTMRSELLLSQSPLPQKSIKIPCVLLNTTKDDYINGFLMLLPGGWAMPFWTSLILQGARIGGLKEDKRISYEALVPHFPSDFSDTEAGCLDAQAVTKEKTEKYQRYPRQVKRNYDLLGIFHPFSMPWDEITWQWNFNINTLLASNYALQNKEFFIIRDTAFLNELNNYMTLDSKLCENKIFENSCGLVHIRLINCHKGAPSENATINIPTRQDFDDFVNRDDIWRDEKFHGPVEPQHKGLRHTFPHVCKSHDVQRYNARYIGVNCRWLLGYVQTGDYSLHRGKGAALGLVSLLGLYYYCSTLSQQAKYKLLVRNIDSNQYKFCDFSIFIPK